MLTAGTLDLRELECDQAATRLYRAICEIAADNGQNPDIECYITSPRETEESGYGRFWRVGWDAGPIDWGVSISLDGDLCDGDDDFWEDCPVRFKILQDKNWYLQPYYSCDVMFVPMVGSVNLHSEKPEDEGKKLRIAKLAGDELVRYYQADPEKMKSMDRRQFEVLVSELFRVFGYNVELTQQTRDGGKDIVALKSVDDISFRFLLECKRPDEGNAISVSVVRQLLGVHSDDPSSKVILVTTSRLSKDAKEFVQRHKWKLEAKEYPDVVNWLDKYVKSGHG